MAPPKTTGKRLGGVPRLALLHPPERGRELQRHEHLTETQLRRGEQAVAVDVGDVEQPLIEVVNVGLRLLRAISQRCEIVMGGTPSFRPPVRALTCKPDM